VFFADYRPAIDGGNLHRLTADLNATSLRIHRFGRACPCSRTANGPNWRGGRKFGPSPESGDGRDASVSRFPTAV
jgi:hypothetical protein